MGRIGVNQAATLVDTADTNMAIQHAPSAASTIVVGDDDTIALVDLAREGDGQAFADLYDRYVDRVYRFVLYRVSGDVALAEDLTSEVFVRALRKIKGFTWQGRDVGAWFLTIARNLVLDHFKSGRFRLEVVGAEPAENTRDGVIDPEDAALARVSQGDLYRAIQQLGNEQQEVIYWRFLQGYSVAETAVAMDKTEGAIKALQYRAVKALYKLVVVPDDGAYN